MKLLVLLAALLLVGCSVEVVHETENKSQTESLSTSDRSKTAVAMSVLEAPETSTETRQTDSATPAVQRSQTIVKVVVPEPSLEFVIPFSPTTVFHSPDQSIRVMGSGTVIFGDIHHHHEHKHFHVHQPPKPSPVQVDIRVEVGDRFSERDRRRRMVERRIAKAFPHYRD